MTSAYPRANCLQCPALRDRIDTVSQELEKLTVDRDAWKELAEKNAGAIAVLQERLGETQDPDKAIEHKKTPTDEHRAAEELFRRWSLRGPNYSTSWVLEGFMAGYGYARASRDEKVKALEIGLVRALVKWDAWITDHGEESKDDEEYSAVLALIQTPKCDHVWEGDFYKVCEKCGFLKCHLCGKTGPTMWRAGVCKACCEKPPCVTGPVTGELDEKSKEGIRRALEHRKADDAEGFEPAEELEEPEEDAVTRAERLLEEYGDLLAGYSLVTALIKQVRGLERKRQEMPPGDLVTDDLVQWLRSWTGSASGQATRSGEAADCIVELRRIMVTHVKANDQLHARLLEILAGGETGRHPTGELLLAQASAVRADLDDAWKTVKRQTAVIEEAHQEVRRLHRKQNACWTEDELQPPPETGMTKCGICGTLDDEDELRAVAEASNRIHRPDGKWIADLQRCRHCGTGMRRDNGDWYAGTERCEVGETI